MTTYYVDGSVGNDSNAGTSAGTGNAWATIAHGLATIAGADLLYVKASATYSIGTGLTASVGTLNQITRMVGYTTTPGDAGRATITATGAITGITISATGCFLVENFVLDGATGTGTVGISLAGTYGNAVINCVVQNWSGDGIAITDGTAGSVLDTEVTGCAGTAAVHISSGAAVTISGCNIHGNSVPGILSNQACTILANRVWGNTGGSSDGIAATSLPNTIRGNTVHGNGRNGIYLAAYNVTGEVRNNILTSNGAYGINNPASPSSVDMRIDYNWFGSGGLANTSGARSGYTAGPHDLSGDPQYVNASTGDFTPQNAAVQAGSP